MDEFGLRRLESREWMTTGTMRIGILGSGLMGGKLGTLFARAGHEVVFSYAHSEQKLKRLAREAGRNAYAGTPAEAARDADVLLLAVHAQPAGAVTVALPVPPVAGSDWLAGETA